MEVERLSFQILHGTLVYFNCGLVVKPGSSSQMLTRTLVCLKKLWFKHLCCTLNVGCMGVFGQRCYQISSELLPSTGRPWPVVNHLFGVQKVLASIFNITFCFFTAYTSWSNKTCPDGH